MRFVGSSILLMFAFSGFGCSRDRAEPPLTPAAAITTPAGETAVDSLANARCQHKQRCNQIGEGSPYSSREHCLNVMRFEAQSELAQCQQGVDYGQLQQCLSEITTKDCEDVSERLSEIDTCSPSDLCLE